MNTDTYQITVQGLSIDVVRKAIKNLHLGVYPPEGRVRVAAPNGMSDEAIRMAVLTRLSWIRRQQTKFQEQARQSEREMSAGECHYYMGLRYRLRIHEHTGPNKVELHGRTHMDLFVRPGLSPAQREQVILRWYRTQLRELIPPLLEKWQATLGVQVTDWGIKKMKTRWGTCNTEARRVWFNLELAKKPANCLEYLVVHELLHLLERNHNDRFKALLDQHVPHWRATRDELKESPLGFERWNC